MSDASDNLPHPNRMERVVLVRPIPAETLAETMLLRGGGADVGLGPHIEENYLSDWRVVSHTVSFQPEGSAILTVLVERPR